MRSYSLVLFVAALLLVPSRGGAAPSPLVLPQAEARRLEVLFGLFILTVCAPFL